MAAPRTKRTRTDGPENGPQCLFYPDEPPLVRPPETDYQYEGRMFNQWGVCWNAELVFYFQPKDSGLDVRLTVAKVPPQGYWSVGYHHFNGGGSSSDAYVWKWHDDHSSVVADECLVLRPDSRTYAATREKAIEKGIAIFDEYIASVDGKSCCSSQRDWTAFVNQFRYWKGTRNQMTLF